MFRRIAIIEDESWASESLLEKLHVLIHYPFEVHVIKTVRDAVTFFEQQQADLIFMDVQLQDSLSFEIFDQVQINAPVIFTTAFENYAFQAFQNQGYAYLLKPYEEEELQAALLKVTPYVVQDTAVEGEDSLSAKPALANYKTRFLVRYGVRLKSIPVTDIAYFMAEDKTLYGYTVDGTNFILEDTITGLVPKLDPELFFQVNRKFIIHIQSIQEMVKMSRNRIRLQLHPALPAGIEAYVSEDKSADFQSWLDQ